MTTRSIASISIVAGLVLAASVATQLVFGQAETPDVAGTSEQEAYEVPMTPWGEPDFQGVWGGRNQTVTPFERPVELGDRAYLTDEEMAALDQESKAAQAMRDRLFQEGTGEDLGLRNKTFEERAEKDAVITGFEYNTFWVDTGFAARVFRQTSLVMAPKNGRIPYKPALQERMAFSSHVVSSNPPDDFVNRSWRDRDFGERCITDGLPGTLWNGTGPTMIIQGPGYVSLLMEQFRDRRIIPTDGREHENISGWFGNGRGHWEGDTLVVDTNNFLDKTAHWPEDRFSTEWRTPTATQHMVERFTRVAADTIDYEMTLTDPSRFTEPITVKLPFMQHPQEQEFFEYACHEGNYGMIHLLSQARNVERAKRGQPPLGH